MHSDAEEPADVSPVGRLSGHTRYVHHSFPRSNWANINQKGRTRTLQPCRIQCPRQFLRRLHDQALGYRTRTVASHTKGHRHLPVHVMERRWCLFGHHQSRQEAPSLGRSTRKARSGGSSKQASTTIMDAGLTIVARVILVRRTAELFGWVSMSTW